jgi:enterobactin synthetase component D
LAAQAALDDIGSNDTEVRVGSHREPIWPTGVVGSISHVEGLAGAVVADSAHFDGVGIDLERIALGDAQVALREVALDATELALLTEARGTLTLDECVTIAFSAKESLYKACYPTVQRLFGFDAVRVQSMDTMDTTRGTITLMILDHLHTRFTRGRLFEIAFFRLYPDLFFTVLQIAAPDAAPPESHLHLPG